MAFSSDVDKWTKHFKHMARSGKVKQKKFYTIQKGSGEKIIDPRIISISPTEQAERIAKSQIENIGNGKITSSGNVVKRKAKTSTQHTQNKRSKNQSHTLKNRKQHTPTKNASKKTKKTNKYKLSRN
jgi:hypothetical protein